MSLPGLLKKQNLHVCSSAHSFRQFTGITLKPSLPREQVTLVLNVAWHPVLPSLLLTDTKAFIASYKHQRLSLPFLVSIQRQWLPRLSRQGLTWKQ